MEKQKFDRISINDKELQFLCVDRGFRNILGKGDAAWNGTADAKRSKGGWQSTTDAQYLEAQVFAKIENQHGLAFLGPLNISLYADYSD